MNLFGRHINGLFDFSGRENRQPFWLWVLITYAIQTVVSMVGTIPIVIIMMQKIEPLSQTDPAYLDAHPEIAQKLFLDAFVPMIQLIMIMAVVSVLIFVVFLAAATVRRLHDTNRSGWWAAPYFAFITIMPAAQILLVQRFFSTFETLGPTASPEQINVAMVPLGQVWAAMMGIGMIGLLLMIVLIVFCCMAGTPGPNKYGEDPLPPRPEGKPFV